MVLARTRLEWRSGGAALAALLLTVSLLACGGPPEPGPAGPAGSASEPVAWAIAVHGGAGSAEGDREPSTAAAVRASLEDALRAGMAILEGGGRSLDAVERVVRRLEDDPLFNAGVGAVFTHDGRHELDASIMDGRTLGCGAVAGVTTVRNPIALARRVMERSRHVFFAGAGADAFAAEQGLELVPNEHFSTPRGRQELERALARERAGPGGSTVGCVALDRHGDLAAGTSTGGLTNKRSGRIGDSPVIGAGTYADNRSCAVSCTGIGEQFIRHTIGRTVAALVELGGLPVEEAARRSIGRLDPGDGGLIAVGRDGSIAVVFNTPAMRRAAADSRGRFEVEVGEAGPTAPARRGASG